MANWVADYLLRNPDMAALPIKKRAKHGIHFDMGNGEVKAEFTGKPIHYEDGGIWKPIDTKLLATSGGFYGSPHSDVKIHPDGRVVVDRSDYQQFTKLPSAKAGRLAGDRIIREFPGGEQHLIMKEDGFKEEIHVFKPTFPLEKFIAKTTGNLPSKYKAHPITAEDADGNSYTFTGDVTAFGKWLDAAKYPVVIDPDFAGGNADCDIYGQNSVYATSRSTSATYTNDITLRCGTAYTAPNYYSGRSYFLFDTSSIGSGNTVTQSNLVAKVKVIVANDTQYIYLLKQDWSAYAADLTNATNRETAFDATLTSTKDANFAQGALSAGQVYTSANLDTTYVNRTGITYYSMAVAADYDGSGYDAFWFLLCSSTEATESYRPVLSVTYTASGIAIPVAQYYYNRLRRN